MTKRLISLLIALVVVAALFVIAYLIAPLLQQQSWDSFITASDVPIRFAVVAVGALLVIGLYLLTRNNAAWTVGTREVVYMAIGAALYGALAWLFNGTVFAVPSVSQVALRPGIVIPILFGYLFGPVVGFFTGAVGNTIGDMLTGWVSPQWSFGNGLIGLVSGLAMLFGGAPHGTTMSIDTAFLHYGEITVKGVFHHTPRYVAEALALIAQHCIDVDALIAETLPLTRLPDAIAGMVERRGFKYALVPGA